MSINLNKGGKINLSKEVKSLDKLLIGLGWDPAKPEPKKGLFGFMTASIPADIDCDASAILCKNGSSKDGDVVYFGKKKSKDGAIVHTGDNLTGSGDGDDEQIKANLDQLDPTIDRIVFVVNIYNAKSRGQHFGMIDNAFIHVDDLNAKKEIVRFNLSNMGNNIALIVGELTKNNGEWEFTAIGETTNDASVNDLVRRFQ